MTGGGSGGHITPLLSLARELKKTEPENQLVYIGHKGDSFDSLKLSAKDFDFTAFINGGKFRRYHGEGFWAHLLDIRTILLNVRDFFRAIWSIFASLKILRRVRADVVFSKGGFVGVPVCIAARLLRLPIITHDSDAVPGLSNRIVGRWAKVNAVGMPTGHYPYPEHKKAFVGIPLAANISRVSSRGQKEFKKQLGLPSDSLALLIAGGGNGSRTINELVVAIAPVLLASNLALHIFHIAGRDHEPSITEKYKAALPATAAKKVRVLGFAADFSRYSGAADLIISRAGATAIAEFAAQAKACIVIPSPFLAGGHQLKNAKELEDKDAAVIVDNGVSAEELLAIVSELLNNPKRRQELAENLNRFATYDASEKMAKIILDAGKDRPS